MTDQWNDLSNQIDQEIVHTEQRLVQLKQAKSAIASLSKGTGKTAAIEAQPPRRRGKGKATAKMSKKAKPGKTTSGRVKSNGRLPSTGSAFWLGVLGDEQHTGREIVNATLAKLGLDDSAHDAIYSRAGNWFNGAVKKGLVVVAGQRDGANVYQRAD